MKLFDAIYKRRSIRRFKDKSVNDKDINKLLKAAMAAPSGRNIQPWLFYIVKDKTKQQQLTNIFRDFNAQAFIVVAGDLTPEDNLNKSFWAQDCSAAIENILLSATALGLGTCWCGIYPKEKETLMVQKILNIKKEVVPIALIQIGYSNEDKEARTQYDKNKVFIV